MKRETKNKILIILAYLFSLFLFELFIGVGTFEQNSIECARLGYDNPLVLFTPYVEAGIYHFIFVSFIAICVRFSKKIDKKYKYIIYWFPLFTFYLSLPMSFPASLIANVLHIF